MDFGDWEGRTYEDLWRDEPAYRHWTENWQSAQIPGGESLPMVNKRVWKFITALPEGPALLLTHAGVIRLVWAQTLAESLEHAMSRSVPFFELMDQIPVKH
ncbi:hypothetical protein L21SP2_2053 [Salinispira pacifica]|uniref:Alpha-ribazole-5'-phosphate phosphatase n=2 Tax=Salinispira pacifica TaxID=1307761 RepID=V5WHW7_9SPIO|nr:hypothetical protein L21SP2_2053 [Salinispira pacifica]